MPNYEDVVSEQLCGAWHFPVSVDALGYKPRWRFRGLGTTSTIGQQYVEAIGAAPDSRGPGRTILTTGPAIIDLHGEERAALRSIFRSIVELELHEAAEWFTYRGERVFDPHSRVLPFAVVEAW